MIDQLRDLDFWPYWDVPRSVIVKEMIPAMQRDSIYLRRQDMELVARGDVAMGDTSTPGALDSLRAGTLRIRQRPGPTKWTVDSVDAALAGPDSRRVALPSPISVIIEYVTVMASHDGTVWFLPDIYGRTADPLNRW